MFLVSAPGGIDSPAAKATGKHIEDELAQRDDWTSFAQSYWSVPKEQRAGMRSTDGEYGLVITHIKGNDNDIQVRSGELADELGTGIDGATVQAGGAALAYHQVNDQTKKDLALSEAIAIPLTAIVLILVFGSLLAASCRSPSASSPSSARSGPVRAVPVTDVSIYAINLTTALGLGLAIDYSLFMVCRFREELAAGRSVDDAVVAHRADGRAHGAVLRLDRRRVAVGADRLPDVLPALVRLRRRRRGRLAAVASIVMLPACLAVIGTRINSLDLRKAFRRMIGRPEPRRSRERGFWYRLAAR